VVEGAAARVRPLIMTVATTVFGLLPLLWESGVGADVSARTAAPVVGGLWSCMLLTLLVLPAAYDVAAAPGVRGDGGVDAERRCNDIGRCRMTRLPDAPGPPISHLALTRGEPNSRRVPVLFGEFSRSWGIFPMARIAFDSSVVANAESEPVC
jgi:AcrB/AcrD/AcrF family